MFAPGRRAPRVLRPLARPHTRIKQRPQILRSFTDVTVKHVKFKEPRFTKKKLATWALYTTAIYVGLNFVLPDIEEEEVEEPSGMLEGEDDADEDAFFIPMGWAQPKPRTLYKKTDPEFKEFLSIGKDHKKRTQVYAALVNMIRSNIANDPRFTSRFGEINTKEGVYWLDITFPPGPPLEYERSGIELSEDGEALIIRWTKRPVRQVNHERLKNALSPTAAIKATYASCKYLCKVQYRKLQEVLGVQPAPDPHMQALKNHIERMRSLGRSSTSATKTLDGQNSGETTSRSTDAAGGRKPGNTGATTAADPGHKTPGLPSLPTISPFGDSTDISIAQSIFRATLSKNWRPLSVEVPRGHFVVSGIVEVVGQKARMSIEVLATYDPKTHRCSIWRLRHKRVNARRIGGPGPDQQGF